MVITGSTTGPKAGQIEQRTQQLGRALIEVAERYRPGPAERMEDWLLTHAVADERFRASVLRYMDVLASLDYDRGGQEAKRLAQEYFGRSFPGIPLALRWLLRVARSEGVPAVVVGQSARRSAELFARRFITPPGADTVGATTRYLAERGRYPSFDLLGEAVLSDEEARSYTERYLALLQQLSADPAAGARTAGDVAALQVSLKLSSLTAHFSPLDPAGTLRRVREPLEAILAAAERAGIGVTIDMEQYEYRDLTWELFRQVCGRGQRFGGWPDIGIVHQGYLRDSARHGEEMIAFARERGVPFQVRLVKGAYWDYETITADAQRWPPPVFTEKTATDRNFERVLELFIAAHPRLRVAVGSHNYRSHARAEALAGAAGLPDGSVEHQTLYRTAEGTSRALSELGWVTRDYVPVGELLPGMAYLVRRVLENSSQAGVLLMSRSGADAEELLRPPPERPASAATVLATRPAAAPPDPQARLRERFSRSPGARWFDPAFRADFDQALARTRAQWGGHLAIEAPTADGGAAGNGDGAPSEVLAVHSPSHPAAGPVGTVELTDAEQARQAAVAAAAAAPAWASTAVTERAAILRRAAALLEERGHEFAAWVVHEGGRDRADAWAEVEEAVDYLNYYAAEAEDLFGRLGDRIAPHGVVATITPWNFSLAIPCGMTAAALVCGNAVILKPAEQTPLIAHRLVVLLHEAGVPRAVLTFVAGHGETAGRALVESPDVAMVAFTGSRAVGVWMHEAVSQVALPDGRVKHLVAELGGKNPVLVFADADLDEAVADIVRSAFGHANQKCSAASRVLVERPVFERLRERLVEAARSLAVGPADAAGTQLNPIIDGAAVARLREAAATARAECTVLLDRFEPANDDAPDGLQLGPLIVELEASRALEVRTATEELFGPILVLIPFADEAEAYRIANGTPYGLTAAVFSRSPHTIERATRAIEAGNVYVNRPTTGARVGVEPFGGMRMSGTGPKAGGLDYLWAFTRRTDVPRDAHPPAHSAAPASPSERPPSPTVGGTPRWDAPVEERIAAVEAAAVRLGSVQHPDAEVLFSAAQAARRELARPQPTVPVAGQRTELRYAVPRGLGLVRAGGPHAASWLAAALLAGNAIERWGSPGLDDAVAALLASGVPEAVLRTPAGGDGDGDGALLARAALPDVAFVTTDASAALTGALHRALGPTAEGQRTLKALLSPLDGAQPGEPGFLRRFAWPRLVARRTLRHGADLSVEAITPRSA